MTRQKLCEWNDCELVSKQNEVESFIDMSFEKWIIDAIINILSIIWGLFTFDRIELAISDPV